MNQDNSITESPDMAFAMAEPAAQPSPESATESSSLIELVSDELVAMLPVGWNRLDAAIAMTVSDEAARVIVSDGQHAVPMPLSARAVELLRELRHSAAESEDGPWWRVLASVSRSEPARIEYDYGSDPFPEQHLFPAEAYLADLQAYPRKRVPVWLAAYMGHANRQTRTPRVAAASGASIGAFGSRVETGLPPLPLMWARWAAIAAGFVAARSPLGPRVTTALGWFEGSSRSGCTLHLLSHGRAVLSGGLWNDPRLDAAYNDHVDLPQLYRGAPDWVADPVLNPRAANGLLSFCYWWDGASWRCGESPAATELHPALPGVWTSRSAVDAITQLNVQVREDAATALVASAEAGTLTRSFTAPILGGAEADFDDAYYQLMLAGLVTPE
ncbi:hypothetical protein [Nocardia sp. NPDC020380]|uniref:hypothetical protein n=1 Tax=Nocardia sp. NPDC020380 TaxID=3364309 RepID=UPI00379B65BF